MGLDLGGVMQHVVEQALPLIEADGAVIELAEDGEMVYRAASGIAASQLGLRLKVDASLSGLCVQSGETLSCADSEVDPRVDRLACQRMGLRSMIVMPLRHRGTAVGAFKAMSAQPGKFQRGDTNLLEMMSDVISAAMYFSVRYDSDDMLFQATHDSMTGLANRALFMDRLRNAVARTTREQRPCGLLMIDMDGLKQVNDTRGHRLGDAVIVEFARRLKMITRETDTAARIGGDEFGVILLPVDDEQGMEAAIRRIRAAMEAPFVFEDRPYPLQASIGAALMPRDGVDPGKVLEIADQRMYAAKKARRRG